MQSSYQYHFGRANQESNSGGVDWGIGSGIGGGFSVGNLIQDEYSYSEDKNYRFRPAMEDTYAIKDKLANDPQCGLFAIFDGHGGRQVADHCSERMPEEMKKEVSKQTGDLTFAIDQVFLKIDNELRLIDADNTGATACVCLVRQEFGHKILYVANVGDTRAVLSKDGVAERMSQDHKASDQSEVQRIRNGGGIVLDNRVGGSLAVTRAFGDHSLKKDGVIAKPYINKHVLRSFDKLLVIASDGIWDVMDDQEAISICKEEISTQEMAQGIIKAALQRGSKDNASCIVIKFNSSPIF